MICMYIIVYIYNYIHIYSCVILCNYVYMISIYSMIYHLLHTDCMHLDICKTAKNVVSSLYLAMFPQEIASVKETCWQVQYSRTAQLPPTSARSAPWFEWPPHPTRAQKRTTDSPHITTNEHTRELRDKNRKTTENRSELYNQTNFKTAEKYPRRLVVRWCFPIISKVSNFYPKLGVANGLLYGCYGCYSYI